MSKEAVDKLNYMGWEIDQGADPVKVFHNTNIHTHIM